MTRIGIIGCGAIGTAVARAVRKILRRQSHLAYVSDINPKQIAKFRQRNRFARFRVLPIPELIRKSDLVIEAASQEVVPSVVAEVLRLKKTALIMSVGGLLSIPKLGHRIERSGARIYVPSGAVAGIDGMFAARAGRVYRASIISRKPLGSLRDAPFFAGRKSKLRATRKPILLFRGTAARAIKLFPQNVNVAATLSLAGIGPERTEVCVYTSSTYRRNTHEIDIRGDFGRIHSTVVNVPSRSNPKTSKLAIYSAIATLEKIFRQVKIGT